MFTHFLGVRALHDDIVYAKGHLFVLLVYAMHVHTMSNPLGVSSQTCLQKAE